MSQMTADRYFELKDTIKMLCDTLPQIDPQFRFREPIRNTNFGEIEKIKMCYRVRMELIKARTDRGYKYFQGYDVDGRYHQGYSLSDTSLLEYPESWVPEIVRKEIRKQKEYHEEICNLATQREKEIQDILSEDEAIQRRNLERQHLQQDEEKRVGYTEQYEKIDKLRKELREGLYSIRTVAEIVNRKYNNSLISIEFNIAKGKIFRDTKPRIIDGTSTMTINDPLIDNDKFYEIKYEFITDTIDVKLVE